MRKGESRKTPPRSTRSDATAPWAGRPRPPRGGTLIESLRRLTGWDDSPPLALIFDFDGTLSPIVPRPKNARLDLTLRRLLERLASRRKVSIAVVSGRSLADLRLRTGLSGAALFGNHGAEFRFPDGHESRGFARSGRESIRRAERALSQKLAGCAGLEMENKGPALSIHYRRVRRMNRAAVRREVDAVARRYAGIVETLRGKCVLELRLRGLPDKGDAVRRLLRALAPGTHPVYFGDDITDRDAFRAVRGRGWSVQVGTGRGFRSVDFTLSGPRELRRQLQQLSAFLAKRPPGGRRRVTKATAPDQEIHVESPDRGLPPPGRRTRD
ncbi:MAG: trehalose-phosphatase [Planctomycetes bacterium]|nr:trehalose-phosphatase [Planctomycetota bacterium]